jgi:competence protein ComEC
VDFWNKIPALKIAPIFILGIWMSNYLSFSTQSSLFFMLLLLAGLFLLVYGIKKLYSSWMYLSIFFVFAFFYTQIHLDYVDDKHFTKQVQSLNEEITVVGQVYEQPIEKPNSIKTFIKITGVLDKEKLINCHGNILVYLEKSEKSKNLAYGDQVLIKARINEVAPPKNPHQFDYKSFLETDGVFHQLYAKSSQWSLSGNRTGNVLLQKTFDLRRSLRQKLRMALKDDDNFAVAAALILGDKSFLDTEILMSYSAAGAMHVLAVSGLHVGMIFLFLQFAFSWIRKTERKWLYPVIVLLFLWFYALLTGFSPSVQRAATMFSFVVIGQSINRPTNIYNSLAASAIFLMIINPMIIYKVGFQLSYIAVIGIVYFHPKIFNLFYIKWWLPRKLWEITVISIAAQISTFPLTLYYFHQFPTYFFVSNLFVIPLASLILAFGFAYLAFGSIGIYQPFEWFLETTITVMNKGIMLVDSLPYSLFYGQYLHKIELYSLYLIILTFMLYISWRMKRHLFYAMYMLAGLLIFSSYTRTRNTQTREFIVYHVPNRLAMNYIGANENILWTDKELLKSDNEKLYYFKHHWFSLGYLEADGLELNLNENSDFKEGFKYRNSFYFNNKRILVLDKEHHLLKGKWDLVVLGDNRFFNFKEWSVVDIAMVVIPTSIPSYKASNLEQYAKKAGLRVWNVWEKGAFILSK